MFDQPTTQVKRAAGLVMVGLLVATGCGPGDRADRAGNDATSTPTSTFGASEPPESAGATATSPAVESTISDAAQATSTAVRTESVCAPAAPGDVELTLLSGGLPREALLHVPPGYDGARPVPLIIDLHGHGGNRRNSQHSHGFDAIADRETALVVYGQGLAQLDNRNGWSTGAPNRDLGTVDDVGYVDDLLDLIETSYCVDSTRIWATGHSNGGGMVAVLACELSGRIDAFAPVAGAFHDRPTTCSPTRPVPILEIHGLDDQVVPYTGQGSLPPIQEWLAEWAARNGCSLDAPVVTGDRSVWSACVAPVEHIAVPGQRHDYPSSSAEWIWEFFARTGG